MRAQCPRGAGVVASTVSANLAATCCLCLWGSVSAPGIFFDPCPTGDVLGGALSAVRAQCNYLDVQPS